MIDVANIYKTFITNQVDFFTGVPDSLLKDICAYIMDNTPSDKNVISANEGTAMGLAAGYFFSTGKIPLVYMQNSGLGNAINPLLSLADKKVYSIPLIMMIGWRGEPNVKDEPQHIKQGEVTLDLLEAMKIPYLVLSKDETEAIQQTSEIIQLAKKNSEPCAIVIQKGTFQEYKLRNKTLNNHPLSREEALKTVLKLAVDDSVFVSTTGKLSRELFELREFQNQTHEKDFLTVGSMGHSSSIALGVALNSHNKKVFCLDGDGAFIMHMGALTNIGNLKPSNYFHIVFNNGAHESVGKQPTLGFKINIPEIAMQCGYKSVYTASTEKEIASSMDLMMNSGGPCLLEIKVNLQSRDDLGRPTTTTIQNKKDFMKYLLSDEADNTI